jgi:hypothetical protein
LLGSPDEGVRGYVGCSDFFVRGYVDFSGFIDREYAGFIWDRIRNPRGGLG